MASSVLVIAVFGGPIMSSMPIRLNVPIVAMCMEQMALTCTKGYAQNAREGLLGSSTGGLSAAK